LDEVSILLLEVSRIGVAVLLEMLSFLSSVARLVSNEALGLLPAEDAGLDLGHLSVLGFYALFREIDHSLLVVVHRLLVLVGIVVVEVRPLRTLSYLVAVIEES